MKECKKSSAATTNRRHFLKWAGLSGVAFLAASCTAKAPHFTVTITTFGTFDPSPLVVPRGSTVTWINQNVRPYTVTCDPNKVPDKAVVQLPTNAPTWDSGILYPGQTWSYTFNNTGDYLYTSQFSNAESSSGLVRVTA